MKSKLLIELIIIISIGFSIFGIYNAEDVEIIKSSNYKSAVTTDEGVANTNRLFELKRIKIDLKLARLK